MWLCLMTSALIRRQGTPLFGLPHSKCIQLNFNSVIQSKFADIKIAYEGNHAYPTFH